MMIQLTIQLSEEFNGPLISSGFDRVGHCASIRVFSNLLKIREAAEAYLKDTDGKVIYSFSLLTFSWFFIMLLGIIAFSPQQEVTVKELSGLVVGGISLEWRAR